MFKKLIIIKVFSGKFYFVGWVYEKLLNKLFNIVDDVKIVVVDVMMEIGECFFVDV